MNKILLQGHGIEKLEECKPKLGFGMQVDRCNLAILPLAILNLFLMTLFVPTIVYADVLLLEDDFDTENDGNGTLNYSGFVNWIVTRGTVDLIGNGFFDLYPGNGLYVDLDGSTRQGGILESRTSFVLDPGIYELQFDIGNNNNSTQYDNTVTVMLGDIHSKSFTRSGSLPYQTILETITVTTPARGRLVFDQSSGDNDGIIIDNVRFTYLLDR